MQIPGGMEPVPPEHRDTLLALLDGGGDPWELVVFLSQEPQD